MIKKISAIVAAAISAGFIVTSVPGFAPPVAASTSVAAAGTADANAVKDIDRAAMDLVRNGSRAPKIICAQSWPHYGPDCLRNTADAKPRAVRVIATDKSAAQRLGIALR
jgi:hypothetical protein